MAAYRLGLTSRENLQGVHPDLVRIVERAIAVSDVDFRVLEGVRSPERQAELVRAGASQTQQSRHVSGHAVDLGALVNGRVRWDWPLYDRIAAAMKAAAKELELPIEWGGDWKTFRDGPHFQLPRKEYP